MTFYEEVIKEATNCPDDKIADIEEYMRDVVFHSTLDWQSRKQLDDAARQAWNEIQAIEGEEPAPQFAGESFIKSVDDAYNTGGGILNDIITLKNGMIIQISEEGICLYKNEEDQDAGNTILWYDEGTDKCWCRTQG